ncbi:MAG TPA: hypothetical protein VID72_08545 [Ktedonobacterales bacterium]|jgi:hypothetical protein
MGTILHITTTVQPDGSIEIHAPGLVPGQQVTVSIDTSDDDGVRTGPHVIDIITALPGHRVFNTADEVDAYIREERDAWDR